jgi:hypothetical protein|tara:strand:- start:56 stop:214 length:159 start_codon:yes stop_codon:yes gene_type:complete
MRIQLWFCKDMDQWRWTLSDDTDSSVQESGQRKVLADAMGDVAKTVEYLRDK